MKQKQMCDQINYNMRKQIWKHFRKQVNYIIYFPFDHQVYDQVCSQIREQISNKLS